MNKKVLWTVVVVILSAVVGYVGYWMGANKSAADVNNAIKSVLDYLNQSEARFNLDECDHYDKRTHSFIDTGGVYKGVWDPQSMKLVGICGVRRK
jgi:uncharacterized protein (UPF0333 family)